MKSVLSHATSRATSKVLLATVVLSLSPMASFAAAATSGRYVEVWNPPESQTSKGNRAKVRSMVPVQARKKHKSAIVKQVADKTTAAQPAMSVGGAPAARPHGDTKPSDTPPRLPPLIGPDGRVLRVGYSGG